MYWTSASVLGAFSLDPFDPEVSRYLASAIAILERALELDPDWDKGSLHELIIALGPALPAEMGGGIERAEEAFKKALAASGGFRASPYVSYASSVAVKLQDYEAFKSALESALAVDTDLDPDSRLATSSPRPMPGACLHRRTACSSSLTRLTWETTDMKLRSIAVLALVLIGGVAAYGQAINLKLAIDAPRNSPWGQSLERMAAEWKRISNGRVNVTVYAGTQGNDAQIIQKMRFGLDMGVFASTGLALVYDDILALSIPSLIRDEAELQSVLNELDPSFRKGLEDKGYTLVSYSYSGWVRMFSRSPLPIQQAWLGLRWLS
jgi:tetratricopeptide (TPR) repeat protein